MSDKLKALKDELVEMRELLKSAKEQDEKDFANEEITRIEAEITALEKGEPAKPEKKTRKRTPSAAKPPKPKKGKLAVEYDGKTYVDGVDTDFCDVLKKQLEARLDARKKAAKTHKTTSVSTRIGSDVAHVISVAIKNIDSDVIAKNPKKYVAKFIKLEKAGNTFFTACKAVLGDDYDSSDVKAEMEGIRELIKKIQEKVKK